MYKRTAVILVALSMIIVGANLALAQSRACDYVQRFKIRNRPRSITSSYMKWLETLPSFDESTIRALRKNTPIRSLNELDQAMRNVSNRTSKKKLLRILFNLKGDKKCQAYRIIKKVNITSYPTSWSYDIQMRLLTWGKPTWYIYNENEELIYTYKHGNFKNEINGNFRGHIPAGEPGYVHLKVVTKDGRTEWWPGIDTKYEIVR